VNACGENLKISRNLTAINKIDHQSLDCNVVMTFRFNNNNNNNNKNLVMEYCILCSALCWCLVMSRVHAYYVC